MNKITLMGRLTKDPEIRFTATNNTPVATFTLAVNRRFKDAEGKYQADFFNVTAWDKNADFCSKYFGKGQQVCIVGRLQNRTWDDNEGKKHYATDIVYEEGYFADSKKKEEGTETGAGQQEGFYPIGEGEDELPF